MALEISPEEAVTAPIPHPLDQDADGVNRPGLHKNPRYHEIRETGTGVADVRRPDGSIAKLVTRYHDVEQVLRNDEIFSRRAAADADDMDLDGTLLSLDGDEHTSVRNAVRGWFTPARWSACGTRSRNGPRTRSRRWWRTASPPTW